MVRQRIGAGLLDKILIVTAIPPDKLNRGGPSGLIWEIIEALKEYNTVEVLVVHKSGWQQRLMQLGICYGKIYEEAFRQASKILVYPNVAFACIPEQHHKKVMTLGPDSTSMVFKRFYRIAQGSKRVKYLLYYFWFLRFEKNLLKKVHTVLVVGQLDARWLRYISRAQGRSSKIAFLPHPLLSGSIAEIDLQAMVGENTRIQKNRRLVFAGDMSQQYVGDYLPMVVKCLRQKKINETINVIVVGKYNHWIYELLKTVDYLNVEYRTWVENYQEICRLGQDIHCVPLAAGAGTKNRVLTAIANGMEIISTPIGLESVLLGEEDKILVHLAKSPEIFADKMLLLSKSEVDEKLWLRAIENRKTFREAVQYRFKKALQEIICR